MRYDLNFRAGMKDRLEVLAGQMSNWENASQLPYLEQQRLFDRIQGFQHCTVNDNLTVCGIDGSGDYPALSYEDSFVYFMVAQARCYRSDRLVGLRECLESPPLFEFAWLPADHQRTISELDQVFARLSGMGVEEVISSSDYRELKGQQSGTKPIVSSLHAGLIYPQASDSGNLAIQLRSVAELAAALLMIKRDELIDYILVDTTFSLPFVSNRRNSLFYEHLKRLCCVEARQRNMGFFALSKSHGLASIESIEQIARDKICTGDSKIAEHWFLRLPMLDIDGWELSLVQGRQVPPIGAVSYLVRFHRNTPVLRLDMDREYWNNRVSSTTVEETIQKEQKIFCDLDYTCHDQRSYGYPYPLKAAHDFASLTNSERVALRKQVIDAAAQKGMKRSLFRSASMATGHE